MSSINPGSRVEGLTLRQAALIAGFGYLLSPVSYAEFSISYCEAAFAFTSTPAHFSRSVSVAA